MNRRKLSDLIDANDPKAVYEEVRHLTSGRVPDPAFSEITAAFETTVDLFSGRYPGYRACNTGYHNLRHTTDTFLAMGRLLHGAAIEGEPFGADATVIALIASLLHDAGYIQSVEEQGGTGAQHTTTHEARSADFLSTYGSQRRLSVDLIQIGRLLISATDLSIRVDDLPFPSPTAESLGRLMAAADLLAQMADRSYLEKLLFLYREFREAGVGDYVDDVDLLKKTVGFYDMIEQRLAPDAAWIDRLLKAHFHVRWQIRVNLYGEAIDRQKAYLKTILAEADIDPRSRLRREGIVRQLEEDNDRDT